MDAHEVKVAAGAVPHEIAQPGRRVVVPAGSVAVLVVPEDAGHAEAHFAREGLHVLLVAGGGDSGEQVRGLGVGEVGFVEGEGVFGAGPGHGGSPGVVVFVHCP